MASRAIDRQIFNKCLNNALTSPHARSNGSSKRSSNNKEDVGLSGRVRVAVRLRPRNAEERKSDADFANCVELEPELHRLKLRKNNWEADTYQFDEVLTEHASQKRVYEVVGKPVVESVLEGYNGTIMAYGQTGTGKTYTLGQLGDEDDSARGIMVRAFEDILSGVSLKEDSVTVSYLQLYMEMIQDLLAPEKENIPIVEDPKMKDVQLPGASVVEIKDYNSFVELLKVGEANRAVANTKLNAESSRSHAMLVVNVRKLVRDSSEDLLNPENGENMFGSKDFSVPTVRRSKLVVVDLAGSERIDKSGVGGSSLDEAKSINLSLTALGKCINAIAEGNSHVPVRDSKLTRLLRDSFGGTARTSLVITIGPSPRHRAETASTIMFGQRAMKVENMVRLKEEYDYKSLCRRLEKEIDRLMIENERQTKAVLGAEDLERTCEEVVAAQNLKHEKEILELSERLNFANSERGMMENELRQRQQEVQFHKQKLNEETIKRLSLERENKALNERLLQLQSELDEMRRAVTRMKAGSGNKPDKLHSIHKPGQNRDGVKGHKSTIVKLFEQLGLENLLTLFGSADMDVQIEALKVVANLAADGANQEKIVEAGGLGALLRILQSSTDETIRRVAAGAIANLAMNESNQLKILDNGAVRLLADVANEAEDSQTLCMVAGALANLCGNGKLQLKFKEEGGIRALLRMARLGYVDVQAQVARGIANFAKCEYRRVSQEEVKSRSLLIEDGVLPWVVTNVDNDHVSIRRHLELAMCHLAQNEANSRDLVNGGAVHELARISSDGSREDIRDLASRILNAIPLLQAELENLHSIALV